MALYKRLLERRKIMHTRNWTGIQPEVGFCNVFCMNTRCVRSHTIQLEVSLYNICWLKHHALKYYTIHPDVGLCNFCCMNPSRGKSYTVQPVVSLFNFYCTIPDAAKFKCTARGWLAYVTSAEWTLMQRGRTYFWHSSKLTGTIHDQPHSLMTCVLFPL